MRFVAIVMLVLAVVLGMAYIFPSALIMGNVAMPLGRQYEKATGTEAYGVISLATVIVALAVVSLIVVHSAHLETPSMYRGPYGGALFGIRIKGPNGTRRQWHKTFR